MNSSSVRLTHPLFVGIGIATALFFSFCAIAAWYSGQGIVSPFFLLFVILGLYVWLNAGETEINDLHIRHRSAFGTHALRWDAVTAVEFDPQGQAVLFRGRNKQLVIPGVAAWPRAQRELALQLLDNQIQHRSLEVRDNLWAAYQWSKNTREAL
jgi:Bacterial PH domain